MLIQTARDIPDALKALAGDLRRLGQGAWADRITLAITMRKEGRELVSTADRVLGELARTAPLRELGYTHRVAAMQHALAVLQIGNRMKPSTLRRIAQNAVAHAEGFQVRHAGLEVIYREGQRTMTIPLEAAEGGSICRLGRLQWDDAAEPLVDAAARDPIQHRIIAALLFLDVPCRIYCD